MTDTPSCPSAMFSGLDCNSAQLIAVRSVQVWESVARELVPLIGERGFATLFARCIHLTRRAHPWLADPAGPDAARPDAARPDAARPDAARPDAARPDAARPDAARFAELATILAGHNADDALAASQALLATFHAALTVLIGAPLTNNILHTIWRGPAPAKEVPS